MLSVINSAIIPTLDALGEVAEWSNAAVLKTVEGLPLPWVRIPPSPPSVILRKSFPAFKQHSFSSSSASFQIRINSYEGSLRLRVVNNDMLIHRVGNSRYGK